MVSSELNLAQNYLALTQKVHNHKTEELEHAKALVAKLQEQVCEAERDLKRATLSLQQVERRLEVVEIDDDDDDENDDSRDEENKDPRMGWPPLVPQTYARRQAARPLSHSGSSLDDTQQRSVDDSCIESYFESIDTIPVGLSAKLRRSLKRYKRKVSRLQERQENGCDEDGDERCEEFVDT
jgi:hypothetical protein